MSNASPTARTASKPWYIAAVAGMASYLEAVAHDAAAEIDSDDPMADEMQQFLTAYLERFGSHWAGASLGAPA